MSKMKKVFVFGTFDFLHVGHIHLLEKAQALGNYLIVCVARDSVVQEIKKRHPIHNEQERMRIIRSLSMVDQVVLGDETIGTYVALARVQPDIIVLGYDQTMLEKNIITFLQKSNWDTTVHRIDSYHPDKKKSSKIKQALNI
jgi:cytidyltransferase-like protein